MAATRDRLPVRNSSSNCGERQAFACLATLRSRRDRHCSMKNTTILIESVSHEQNVRRALIGKRTLANALYQMIVVASSSKNVKNDGMMSDENYSNDDDGDDEPVVMRQCPR